jgi:O-antigen ligase
MSTQSLSIDKLSFPLIGLLLLITGLVAALVTDMLPLFLAVVVFAALTLLSYNYPSFFLILLINVSILFNLDVAVAYGKMPRIGPTRLVMAAFLLSVMLHALTSKRGGAIKHDFPFLSLVGLYLMSGITSSILSVDKLVSFNAVMGRDLIEQFLLFYILLHYLRQQGFEERLKKSLYTTLFLVCIFSFIEELSHYNPLYPFYPHPEVLIRSGLMRVRSTFFHPIAFGCFLTLLTPILAADIAVKKSSSRKLFMILTFVAALVACFLTVSRAPFIILGMEMLLMSVWWMKGRTNRIIMLTSFVTVVSVSIALLAYNGGPLNRAFEKYLNPNEVKSAQLTEDSSEYYRLILMESVFEKLSGTRWIYGYGPNAFYLADVNAEYSSHTEVLEAPDNNYLRLLLEYGVMGTLLYGLLLLSALKACFAAIKNSDGNDKLPAAALLASALGFIAVNFSASMFNIYPLGLLFWLVIALAINSLQKSRQKLLASSVKT